MFDDITGRSVGAKLTATIGPYILVPWREIDGVCRLLAAHRIPYAVEGSVPGLGPAPLQSVGVTGDRDGWDPNDAK